MNKFEQRSKDTYNIKADDYDNSDEGRFTLNFQKILLENIQVNDNDNVLDVACGNGRFLNKLATITNINGYGVDISNVMIDNAKKLNPSMKFEIASCSDIPYSDNMFDVITISAAYHHFPNVNEFAKEAYRLLKDNGTIYIVEIYYNKFFRTIFNPFVPLSKAGDVKFYAPKEIIDSLKKVGFKNEQVIIDKHIQLIKMEV